MDSVRTGAGWTATHLAELGDGPGFRKIRSALGITAFGMNAIVLPPGIETGRHFHERQEEVYFVHSGRLEMELGEEGVTQTLEPGSIVRVDAATVRRMRNVGDEDAVYVVVGGAAGEGYVGRDGRVPDADEARYRTSS
jgi:mannose-6-phosphate isomerase-like protein (cupin superfamily)